MTDSESSRVVLARDVTFNNSFLLSDGIGSSGKRLLAHVAALIDGVEKLTHNPWFETVAALHWLGHIQTESAVALLRTEADRHSYHLMLGREVNLRRGETTSIFTNPRPLRYLRRILRQQEGQPAVERITTTMPIVNEGTHDGLRSGPLFAQAFGDRLILLHVVRHPADLALDWLRRGFATRIGTDPQDSQLLIRRAGSVEPLPFIGEEPGRFERLNRQERVLAMLAHCFEENLRGLQGMPAAARVGVYSLEEIVMAPEALLTSIESLTGRQRATDPRRLFRKEGVPRPPTDRVTTESQLFSTDSPAASGFYARCLAAYEELLTRRIVLQCRE